MVDGYIKKKKEKKDLLCSANAGNSVFGSNYRELVKKRLRHVTPHSPAREFNVGRFLAPKFYASIYNWNHSVVAGGLFQTVPANYSRYSYSSSFPWDSLWEDFVPSHNEIAVSLHHSPYLHFSPLYDMTPSPIFFITHPPYRSSPPLDRLPDDTRKHEKCSELGNSRPIVVDNANLITRLSTYPILCE